MLSTAAAPFIAEIISACNAVGGSAPAAAEAARDSSVEATRSILTDVPPQALAHITRTINEGDVPVYHGSSALVLVNRDLLEKAAFTPEEISYQNALKMNSVGLVSFKNLMESETAELVLTGRNTTGVPKGYKNMGNMKNTTELWVGAQRTELQDEPIGLPYATAQMYASRMVSSKGFDPEISQEVLSTMKTEINTLEPVVVAGQATGAQAAAYNRLSADYNFLFNRQVLIDRINAAEDPNLGTLMTKAMKTPVILESKLAPDRLQFNGNSNFDTTGMVVDGELPFTDVTRAYFPVGADKGVMDLIKSMYPNMDVVIDPKFNVASMPSAMFSAAFKASQAVEAVSEWMPIAGAVTLVSTPAGVIASDVLGMEQRYVEDKKKGVTDMDLPTFYAYASNWKRQLEQAGDDGIGNSIFQPVVDLANTYEGEVEPNTWRFDVVRPGEAVTLPVVMPDGMQVKSLIKIDKKSFLGKVPEIVADSQVNGDQKLNDVRFAWNGQKNEVEVSMPDGSPAVVEDTQYAGHVVVFEALQTDDQKLNKLGVKIWPFCEYRYLKLDDGAVVIGTKVEAVGMAADQLPVSSTPSRIFACALSRATV